MGNLTNDMTRLRREVDALRDARGMLMQDLTRGAYDLTTAVAAMRAEFIDAHMAMAQKTGAELVAYVANIKNQVDRMREENASDLAGASQVWFGTSPVKNIIGGKEKAESRARKQAEATRQAWAKSEAERRAGEKARLHATVSKKNKKTEPVAKGSVKKNGATKKK